MRVEQTGTGIRGTGDVKTGNGVMKKKQIFYFKIFPDILVYFYCDNIAAFFISAILSIDKAGLVLAFGNHEQFGLCGRIGGWNILYTLFRKRKKYSNIARSA
jgi:hypothetical protein